VLGRSVDGKKHLREGHRRKLGEAAEEIRAAIEIYDRDK